MNWFHRGRKENGKSDCRKVVEWGFMLLLENGRENRQKKEECCGVEGQWSPTTPLDISRNIQAIPGLKVKTRVHTHMSEYSAPVVRNPGCRHQTTPLTACETRNCAREQGLGGKTLQKQIRRPETSSRMKRLGQALDQTALRAKCNSTRLQTRPPVGKG